MTTVIALIDPSDSATFEIDWSGLVGDATLGTVTHTVPSPMTKVSESTDAVNVRSLVRVSGAAHGAIYMIEASSTLSDGQVMNRQFPLRCFNG